MLCGVGLSLRGMGSGSPLEGLPHEDTPLSLPTTDNLCDTPSMRNLTATICLTIAVLLGSVGVSWSADFQTHDSMYAVGGIIFLSVILLISLFGVVKTFRRQPVVAILCIIFLMPIYIIWAFCELFTRPIHKQ